MKNRIVSILLLVCMILGLLSSCDIINPSPDPGPQEPEYKVTLSSSKLALDVGESFKLTANISPASDDVVVSWKSSDSSIASVSGGVVTAIAEGSAVVEAILPNGNSAYCVVVVLPVEAPPADDNDDTSGEDPEKDPENNSGNNPGNNPGNSNTPSGEVPIYDGSEVTIEFYHAFGATASHALDEIISDFNKMYPNINVVHKSLGAFDVVYDQIRVELMAGSQPDIAVGYTSHFAAYSKTNKLLPLNDFMLSTDEVYRTDGTIETVGFTSDQLNDFVRSFFAEGKSYSTDGRTYSLPFYKGTEVLYYNKTLFEQHGFEVPTTWDEVEELCIRLKELYPECTPFGYDSMSNLFITLASQYGNDLTEFSEGNYSSFDNDINKAFIKMLREWDEKEYIAFGTTYLSYPFTDGSLFMYVGSTGGATYSHTDSFEVGIAPIPQVDPDSPRYISSGPSLCIFDTGDSQRAAASWLFVKYLTTNAEAQVAISTMTMGYAPVIKSAYTMPEYIAYLEQDNIVSDVIKVVINYDEDGYIPIPIFSGWDYARENIGYMLQRCIFNETDDIDALIEEAYNRFYSEYKYDMGID